MKRTLILAALIALALAACNLPSNEGPDMENVATLGAITSAAPTQGQAPTLMPVPTLTLIPFEYTPNPTIAPLVTVTSVNLFGATRIQFGQGEVGATVVGTVTAPGRAQYILYAFQKQHMFVELSSPNDAANFAIVAVSSNTPLKRLENEDRKWDGFLPATDDYLISVAVGSGAVDFKLSVTILWQ
ncbi:MAG: hypothetical protein AB1750_19780 [Chloroflexota bacterium]